MRVTGEVLGEKSDFFDYLFNLAHTVGLVFEELEVIKTFGNDIVNGSTLVQ